MNASYNDLDVILDVILILILACVLVKPKSTCLTFMTLGLIGYLLNVTKVTTNTVYD